MEKRRFILQSEHYTVFYTPDQAALQVECGQKTWRWVDSGARLCLTDGRRLNFSEARCHAYYRNTPVLEGVVAEYTAFEGTEISIHTFVGINAADGALHFELSVAGDARGEIERLFWPAAFEYDIAVDSGYSVLPQMQGVLLPARWPGKVPEHHGGRLCTRHAYMNFFGQTDAGRGYLAIFCDPYDARIRYGHVPGGETLLIPSWETSLGRIGRRTMRYYFYESCDYVTFCKQYRAYVKEIGQFVSLREKIARNPNAAYLIGSPVIHEGIAVHINKVSHYYTPGQPEKNDSFISFDERAEQLRRLRSRGVEKAYLHLDGWGCHGYDNLHPMPFPVHAAAGGADGMRRLSDTCAELGYRFGIHDQYRDFYYDSPAFSFDQCVEEIDGGHPYCDIWYGGAHSYLCAELAPDYVRRNYAEFERLGIRINGAYLDVFSVADLDECFNKHHEMTRKACAARRREALACLTARGIIASSEEVVDTILPAIELCHHAPMSTQDLGAAQSEACGIPIPLFELVYHECVVVPWYGIDYRGGWGIPGDRSGFLCALLHGGTIAYSAGEREANIEKGKEVLRLHARTALCEMIGHRFLDDSYLRQETTFEDGTKVYVDYEKEEYRIAYAE